MKIIFNRLGNDSCIRTGYEEIHVISSDEEIPEYENEYRRFFDIPDGEKIDIQILDEEPREN